MRYSMRCNHTNGDYCACEASPTCRMTVGTCIHVSIDARGIRPLKFCGWGVVDVGLDVEGEIKSVTYQVGLMFSRY